MRYGYGSARSAGNMDHTGYGNGCGSAWGEYTPISPAYGSGGGHSTACGRIECDGDGSGEGHGDGNGWGTGSGFGRSCAWVSPFGAGADSGLFGDTGGLR